MLVLVLISVLQLCIRFPAVAGDCYDDPLNNNRSYDNCGTCYQTLANALINTGDNKYYLGKTFFPHDAVMPVQVTVTYKPINEKRDIKCQTDGGDTTWYWIQGEFFAYQPLDVFTYRSLFFSHPPGRQSSIDLYLPYQCLCNFSNEFFEYLTQRLSFHVSYHTGRYISDTYEGRAIKASHPRYDDDDVLGDIGLPIVQAVYVVPFGMVFVVLIISIVAVYVGGPEHRLMKELFKTLKRNTTNGQKNERLCDPNDHDSNDHDSNDHDPNDQVKQKLHNTLKKYKNALRNNLHMQANLTAISLICCLFTIYTFTLDIVSVVVESNTNLPKYFVRMSYGLYVITIVCTVVSLLFEVIGIIWFLVVMCHNFCRKEKWEVYIPIIFCIGSVLLSLAFHFQNILIAWSTDPFYASRISLLYGIIIFTYFVSFKYAYIVPIKITRRNEDTNNHNRWSTSELILVAISLSITTVVCTSITVTVSLFVAHVPTNRSLEQSITGIGTMYNGGVILVGGLVAYSVGTQYFGNGFSLQMALKKAMKDMKNAPFNPDDGTWQKLTEEGRMTEVMKALINRQGFSLQMSLKKAMKDMDNAPFNPDDDGTWQQLTEEGRMTEVMKALINRQACLPRQEMP